MRVHLATLMADDKPKVLSPVVVEACARDLRARINRVLKHEDVKRAENTLNGAFILPVSEPYDTIMRGALESSNVELPEDPRVGKWDDTPKEWDVKKAPGAWVAIRMRRASNPERSQVGRDRDVAELNKALDLYADYVSLYFLIEVCFFESDNDILISRDDVVRTIKLYWYAHNNDALRAIVYRAFDNLYAPGGHINAISAGKLVDRVIETDDGNVAAYLVSRGMLDFNHLTNIYLPDRAGNRVSVTVNPIQLAAYLDKMNLFKVLIHHMPFKPIPGFALGEDVDEFMRERYSLDIHRFFTTTGR